MPSERQMRRRARLRAVMHAAILRVPQLLSAAQQIASGNPAGAVALVREARSLARTAKAAGQRAGISRAEMQAHMEAVAKGNAPTLQDVTRDEATSDEDAEDGDA